MESAHLWDSEETPNYKDQITTSIEHQQNGSYKSLISQISIPWCDELLYNKNEKKIKPVLELAKGR